MIDFHAHILPGFDDGPTDEAESRLLVEELVRQGVSTVVSTSHFYPERESPEDFVRRRNEAFLRLQESCGDIEDLQMIRGAEVYCNVVLKVMADFSGLVIEGTSAILIELPNVNSFSDIVIKILRRLADKCGLVPVIAHAERYREIRYGTVRKIRKLKKAGCMIQINCDSIVGEKYGRTVRKILDSGLVDLLGSDCHDMTRRPPHMRKACDIIAAEYGKETLDRLLGNAERLVGERPGLTIWDGGKLPSKMGRGQVAE